MITLGKLQQLLHEIEGCQTTGAPTVKGAINLVQSIVRGTRVCYRVEVDVQACHHDHHSSWMVIFVEATYEGIELMRQRVSSCPVGGGQFCGETDSRPLVLEGEEEFRLFREWGRDIVVPEDILALLKAKNNFPYREFVLANSHMRTLMMLSDAIGDLVAAVRKAIPDLEATKKMFESEAVADVRRSLDWALVGLENATSR